VVCESDRSDKSDALLQRISFLDGFFGMRSISIDDSENPACVERLEAAAKITGWVAHQINNPLASTLGNAQLLARRLQRDISDPDLLSEYMRYIDGIRDQVERCARITSEMLSMTRLGEPDMQPVDVFDQVCDSVELASCAFDGSNIALVPNGEQELPKARADSEWLSRVLFELLSNAVEASQGRQVSVRVGSVPGPDGSVIEVEIEDCGTGIPANDLPRIFDPFFSTREEARGLGLTISLGMMRKMKGDLRLNKCDAGGCIFGLSIPAWRRRG